MTVSKKVEIKNLFKTIEEITDEILQLKIDVKSALLNGTIEIGKRLLEAKTKLGHGDFSKWLQSHVDYSHSTANKMMQIAKEYDGKSELITNISYTQALVMLGLPEEQKEEIIKSIDSSNTTVKELKERVQVIKKQEIEVVDDGEELDKKFKDLMDSLSSWLLLIGQDISNSNLKYVKRKKTVLRNFLSVQAQKEW